MATWRDENENMDYTLRQVLKKIECNHKPTLSMWNEYSIVDHEIDHELDEF